MTLLLRKRDLLSEKTLIIAKIAHKEDGGISRENLEKEVEEHERVGLEDIDKAVRLLRMTDNMKIEDEKAVLTPLDFYENEGFTTDTVLHRFES